MMQYGTVKRIEHFVKGLSHDRTQISPIPPQGYGDRFYRFINGITLCRDESDRTKQSGDSERRSASVERTMQAAEKEAVKEQLPPHPRTLATVWTGGAEAGEAGASALPIVEEAGESSSTGGHSQHGESWPLPNSEKELPPLPNGDGSHEHCNRGNNNKNNGSSDSKGKKRETKDSHSSRQPWEIQ